MISDKAPNALDEKKRPIQEVTEEDQIVVIEDSPRGSKKVKHSDGTE